ncbi:hypothetical protein M0R45_002130 [Rubus argutus]|uniref:Uncharacterized protein n=1 Tax=Rubus argutus TaxID=59490 RepID=A0AAW1VF94_RUBAR
MDKSDDGASQEHSQTRKESKFSQLMGDAEQELYPGCQKFSKLSFIVKLLHLKIMHTCSNKSFTALLELLKEALPDGPKSPGNNIDVFLFGESTGGDENSFGLGGDDAVRDVMAGFVRRDGVAGGGTGRDWCRREAAKWSGQNWASAVMIEGGWVIEFDAVKGAEKRVNCD